MSEYKILITGTMGAGKTTAIAAVSDIAPVTTEVPNNDASCDKALTTVGMDYGELALPSGERLRLYGTPGQERFQFMWKILAQGALGLIILVDNSRPDPLADLEMYLTNFSTLIRERGCVVAVGRCDSHPTPTVDAFAARMAEQGLLCPVVEADARSREDILNVLDLLILQLETRVYAS